ncbi:hypothetical protein Dimus_012401 [Dionaea muscipula]
MVSSYLILSVLSSLLLVLLSLSSPVSARPGRPFHPCNTLLISTYSLSFRPRDIIFPGHPDSDRRRPEFFAVVAEVRGFDPKPDPIMVDRMDILPNPSFLLDDEDRIRHPDFPIGVSSLRDRTFDILNVVASLLFGAACGTLTAGAMYFVWSLFSNRRDDASRSLEGFTDEDDDDDIFNPKKPVNGYVAVPAAPPVAVESETADVPAKDSV